MDPLAHTLFGAALSRTNLARRTPRATATLVVGANLPDVDVLAYAWGPTTALWFRRGLTHGVLGLLVLPLLLTAGVLVWDRLARRRPSCDTAFRPVLAVSMLAVWSHPVLDSLNVYGMRWLVPFSNAWFYGDTLFIVDPWVWLILALAVALGGSWDAPGGRVPDRTKSRLAALCFGVFALYVALMAGVTVAGRRLASRAIAEETGRPPDRLMVAPVPVTPFTRHVVAQVGDRYRFGTIHWLDGPRVALEDVVYDRFPAHYAVTAATRGPEVRKFLSWARFPYYQVEPDGDGFRVLIGDARYTREPADSWAGIVVRVGAGGPEAEEDGAAEAAEASSPAPGT